MANGIAMDAQELGRMLACLGLPAGQQLEHREPWFLTAIMFALQALLEGFRMFGHDRQGVAPRLLS